MNFGESFIKIVILVKCAIIITVSGSHSTNSNFYSSYFPTFTSKMYDKYATINRVPIVHYFKDVPASHHIVNTRNNEYIHKKQNNSKFLRNKQSTVGIGHTHENYRHPFEVSSSSHQPDECDGFGNFLIDVGIVSYVIGWISSVKGIYTLILSFINQFITYVAAYFVSAPSSILTLGTLVNSNEVLVAVNTLWGLFSVVDTGVNIFLGLPFNDHINYISAIAEFLGIVSLLIGIGSTFPDLFEEFLEIFIDPHEFFKDYGCPSENFVNPAERFFNQLVESLF